MIPYMCATILPLPAGRRTRPGTVLAGTVQVRCWSIPALAKC